MSKALSLDLRVRVLAAVHAGATHREAAERFGVNAASVSRWRTREREPKALGGDRRSKRIEAYHEIVMAALGPDGDATIEEVRRTLAAQGLSFGFGTIQRFFARHDITRKRPRTLRSKAAPTLRNDARNGSKGNSISSRSA
jgi:transposase